MAWPCRRGGRATDHDPDRDADEWDRASHGASAPFLLAGLSSVTLVFDDDADNFVARQQTLEKLAQAHLPPNVPPQLGPDYSPTGQLYFFTLRSTNPQYDSWKLKALEDFFVEGAQVGRRTSRTSIPLAEQRGSTKCR